MIDLNILIQIIENGLMTRTVRLTGANADSSTKIPYKSK